MKKGMSLALALMMALSLAACQGETEPQPAPTGDPVEVQVVTLEYFQEGEPVTVQAVRYEGEGYTIDIPAEGWRQERETEDEVSAVSWEAEVNDEVELELLLFDGKPVDEAHQWVLAEEADYDLTEDEQGNLTGMDPEDGDILEVRFFEGSETVCALLLKYPLEAAEGFGTTMGVMADTFQWN